MSETDHGERTHDHSESDPGEPATVSAERPWPRGLAEYALILALIAIVAIIALIFLGGQVSKILSNVGHSV